MLDKRKRDESGSLADTWSVGFVIHICLSESQSKRVGLYAGGRKGVVDDWTYIVRVWAKTLLVLALWCACE